MLLVVACTSDEKDPMQSPATTAAIVPTETAPGTTTQRSAKPLRLRLVEVASGLESPLFLTVAPGEEDRLYVVERDGRIRVLEDGRVLPDPFLDIVDEVTSGGEQGLLSVAFHPDYAENRLFYVNYTDRAGDTRVVEYRSRGGAEPESVRGLLLVDQPYANHNGGQLQFGPDGSLYVGMGDGGAGGDPANRAQNLSSPLGKLLRLDVERAGADWQTVAYGLRNPWRFSFDRETGDLYIGDVGQGEWEEIDYLSARSRGLVNFGWDAFEGDHVYEDKQPNSAGRLVGPVVEYSHELGCSVTGGYVYRGEALPAARGRYFYGDYCSGIVWTVRVRNGQASSPRRLPFEVESLSSFGEDARGELYLVSLDGTVFRLAER
jgi:glucose/arabinose dehydrogenase